MFKNYFKNVKYLISLLDYLFVESGNLFILFSNKTKQPVFAKIFSSILLWKSLLNHTYKS